MSSTKNKKPKPGKKEKSSDKTSQGRAVALIQDPKSQIIFKYIFSYLLLIYMLFYLIKLFSSSLGETYFWADENTHAYISSLILETHKLPLRFPDDIYGGFAWSYPPLFHIMAAGIMAVAGFSALKYINLILLLLFFICFYVLILKYYGQNEAVIACLLTSLSPILAINSIRFMTDIFSMILLFFSAFFFLRAIEKNNFLPAAFSGIATGLLLLSKQTGIIVFSFYCLLLLWFLWRDKTSAKTVCYIIGASLVIYTPYLIWGVYHKIDVSGFLFYYFGNMPEWATLAMKSLRRYDSSVKELAYLFYVGNGLVLTVSFLVPVYYMIKSRAKELPYNCLFFLLIYLITAMSVWHITSTRHTLSLLPILAFLVAYGITHIARKKTYLQMVILLLIIASAYSVFKMPDYRQRYNAPREFLELTEIINKDHASDGRTLSIYAFDTLMYTRKPVIWPYPNLKNIPIDIMEKQTVSQLYHLLKKYQIDYILIDTRFIFNVDHFNGRNYPLYFIRNCEQLDKHGKLQLRLISNSKNFVLLKVN